MKLRKRKKAYDCSHQVKEVDLEKEVNDYGYHYDYVSLADRKELVDFAKHFGEWHYAMPCFQAGAEWGKNHAMAEIQAQSMALAHGCPKEPASEDFEDAVNAYIGYAPEVDESSSVYGERQAFKAGAKWKKEQIEEVLLSEVLPCFMHGGEADEVVAKLDEVLNQKK